jgi:hypothetical protein
MGPTFYRHMHMVIEIASDLLAPSFLLISIVPTTVAKDHVISDGSRFGRVFLPILKLF